VTLKLLPLVIRYLRYYFIILVLYYIKVSGKTPQKKGVKDSEILKITMRKISLILILDNKSSRKMWYIPKETPLEDEEQIKTRLVLRKSIFHVRIIIIFFIIVRNTDKEKQSHMKYASGFLIDILITFNKAKRGCVRHSQVFSSTF